MSPSAIHDTPMEGCSPIEATSNDHMVSNGKPANMFINTNGHATHSGPFTPVTPNGDLDIVCIGFGPASLAIAIALHDAYAASNKPAPKVVFLEKQPQFAWHAGMQLPGAHMQISFLKDLATPRDPRSKFTFINYLHSKGRLNTFINLGTFLPSRMEYEDYLRWCASHFEADGCVRYGMDVSSVVPSTEKDEEGKVARFTVTAVSPAGEEVAHAARHVVVAVGGKPIIPAALQGLKHVSHSSQFATSIGKIQEMEKGRKLKFAVVGNGQSGAEIFNDLWDRFPDSEIRMIIRGASLRPSDDSPFVNEIFDPDRVDGIYKEDPAIRSAALKLDKGTNYGVVRLDLLEHLYEKFYIQRIKDNDSPNPRCQILNKHNILSAEQTANSGVLLKLQGDEEIECDYVFTATGYRRNAHEEMLKGCEELLEPQQVKEEKKWTVGRDYRVQFGGEKVSEDAGVWLQGCNEMTHGLSDTLLSILSIRGGEMVQSIFGKDLA